MAEPTLLSIVIPAYNEESRLTRSLPRVFSFMEQNHEASELIVVDDGSEDGTFRTARELLSGMENARVIRYTRNQGKGYAVRTGVLASRGAMVLFCDADLSTPLEDVHQAVAFLRDGYDIAIGSRGLAEARVVKKQPAYRRWGARAFKRIVQGWLGLSQFEDTQCGFKLFTREAARTLFSKQRVRGFMFDVEILCRAVRAGYRIKEFPVTWVNDADSRLRLVSDSARMVKDLWWIRFRA